MHPLVLAALLIAGILIFLLPPKKVLIPILVAVFLIPLGQQLYIAGVHFLAIRIIILLALMRIITIPTEERSSRMAGGWTAIDTAFFSYVLIQAVAILITYRSSDAIINQSAMVLDVLGGYFVFRVLLRSRDEVNTTIKTLAFIAAVVATGMLIERHTLSNVFGLLKGVAQVPEIRDGRVRSQGSFQHALTAGAFATTCLPLFVMVWKNRSSRIIAALGLVAATVMALTTSTSTSLLSLLAGCLAVLAWPLRKKMQMIRRGLVLSLIGLAVVMKAPVWFVIAHIDLTGSSSSYQRALLVDQFIRNFWNWWLVGSGTAGWGWDMWDVQNQYVAVGTVGGLAALVAFILVISRAFSRIGMARKSSTSISDEWVYWLLGAALFVDVVSFFGVNFFDQVRLLWCALVAMVVVLTVPSPRDLPQPVREKIVPGKRRLGMKRSVPAYR
jgi:hypothetical protein